MREVPRRAIATMPERCISHIQGTSLHLRDQVIPLLRQMLLLRNVSSFCGLRLNLVMTYGIASRPPSILQEPSTERLFNKLLALPQLKCSAALFLEALIWRGGPSTATSTVKKSPGNLRTYQRYVSCYFFFHFCRFENLIDPARSTNLS